MLGDRPSLDLIMRDERRDSSLTLSLARTPGISYGFGGGILLSDVPVVLPTWVWLHASDEFANVSTEEFLCERHVTELLDGTRRPKRGRRPGTNVKTAARQGTQSRARKGRTRGPRRRSATAAATVAT